MLSQKEKFVTVAHTKGLGLGKGTRPFYGVLSSAHMTTTEALRAALAGDGETRTLTLDRAFQGLPDMAHGGSVLAAFDAAAGRRGPRTLRGHYLKRVPLGTPLALRVTLHAEPKAEEPITVAGARAAVRPRADDARYLDTAIAARDAAGRVVASAAITFVAVRGAARRLATGMLAVNDAVLLRRVFPAYVR